MSTDPKIPAKSGRLVEMNLPGVTPGNVGGGSLSEAREVGGKTTIGHFDKTGIYQQIVQADSAKDVEDLEKRIELIEAIQRVPMLETLPETALYFLETELSFTRHGPKETIGSITDKDHFDAMYLVVEGQVMVLGEEAPGRNRVINILKKGEFFFDRTFNWAGLPAVAVTSVMPVQIIRIPAKTLQKISKVSTGVRKRLKAVSVRMDKRAEKFSGNVGKVWNYLVKNGYSYSERVRVIRVDKCIECDACYIGCETRHGNARIWKTKNRFGLLNFPDACRTCEFTHCTAHCPGDHIYFNTEYREVVIKDSCTGCTHCAEDCPYGVIKMVERDDEPGRMKAEIEVEEVEGDGRAKKKPAAKDDKKSAKGKAVEKEEDAPKSDKKKMVAIKCDHCFGHGDMACVTPCPTHAIFDLSQRELFERLDLYGVVSDAEIEDVARTLRPVVHEAKPGEGNGFHAFLWAVSLFSAAVLGWESWARIHRLEWSFSFLIASHSLAAAKQLGFITEAGTIRIDPIDATHGLGRWLGWVGSVMLSLTLAYVPRKRIEKMLRWFPRAAFLDVHVFLGMLGFVFATYHTTFKLVSGNIFIWVFWACMLVVLTGIVGRYFYGQLPRTQTGNEMKLEDAQAAAAMVEHELGQIFPDNKAFMKYLAPMTDKQKNIGILGTLVVIFTGPLARSAKLSPLKGRLIKAGQTRKQAGDVVRKLKLKGSLEQKILLYENIQKITKTWLYVHIFAAVIMFVVLAYHVYFEIQIFGWT